MPYHVPDKNWSKSANTFHLWKGILLLYRLILCLYVIVTFRGFSTALSMMFFTRSSESFSSWTSLGSSVFTNGLFPKAMIALWLRITPYTIQSFTRGKYSSFIPSFSRICTAHKLNENVISVHHKTKTTNWKHLSFHTIDKSFAIPNRGKEMAQEIWNISHSDIAIN